MSTLPLTFFFLPFFRTSFLSSAHPFFLFISLSAFLLYDSSIGFDVGPQSLLPHSRNRKGVYPSSSLTLKNVKSPLVFKKIKSFDPVNPPLIDVVHYMFPVTVIGSEDTVGSIMSLIGPSGGSTSQAVVVSETLLKVRPFVHTAHGKFFASLLLRNPGLVIFTSPEDVNK